LKFETRWEESGKTMGRIPRKAQSDLQFNNLALSAWLLIGLIDAFTPTAADTLATHGWDVGNTFALRAELLRVARCAERARFRHS
jgi:hypothetical protein